MKWSRNMTDSDLRAIGGKEMSIDTTGGRLFCRVVGKGKGDPLILIHGGPGFTHDYLWPLSALGDDRPVVFYDQLDSGRSDRVGDPALWTVERFAGEVEIVRRALGFDRYFILGHSWGGTVAAEVATSRPTGLKGCILASPLLSTPQWLADNNEYLKNLPEPYRDVLVSKDPQPEEKVAEATDVFYRRHFCRLETWPEELVYSSDQLNKDLYRYMWGDAEFEATGTLLDYDITGRLPQIQCPTLVMCGELDEAAPASMKRFAALIPGAQVQVFANASHNAHLEAEAEYVASVRSFLASLDEAAVRQVS